MNKLRLASIRLRKSLGITISRGEEQDLWLSQVKHVEVESQRSIDSKVDKKIEVSFISPEGIAVFMTLEIQPCQADLKAIRNEVLKIYRVSLLPKTADSISLEEMLSDWLYKVIFYSEIRRLN